MIFYRSDTNSSLPDIDTLPYPGQPELADNDGECGASKPSVPTVLTKLQKWGDYAAFGTPVQPTRFIPMKTPLSDEILGHWTLSTAPRFSLTVADLLEHQHAAGRKVGMILDLSNHECLYTADVPEEIHYKHIYLVAKEVPPADFVSEVCTAAAEFWAEHPEEYIAVHCAYGFNRTGFVLACYLIERCGLSVADALHAFALSRPPGIKHEQFKQELHRRYSHGQLPSTAGEEDAAAAEAESGAAPDSCQTPAPSDRKHMHRNHEGSSANSASAVPGGLTSPLVVDGTPDSVTYSMPTPMSENDSLGVTDRLIMQSLRERLFQMTPSELDAVLARQAPSAKLSRQSLGAVQWAGPDDSSSALATQQDQKQGQEKEQQQTDPAHCRVGGDVEGSRKEQLNVEVQRLSELQLEK